MKPSKNIWYYVSIAGIIFSVGVIIYGIVTSETVVLGKFVLLLGISIYFFVKERKARKEVEPEQHEGNRPKESP